MNVTKKHRQWLEIIPLTFVSLPIKRPNGCMKWMPRKRLVTWKNHGGGVPMRTQPRGSNILQSPLQESAASREKLVCVNGALNDLQRNIIQCLGLGSLLELNCDILLREFVASLLDHFDPLTSTIAAPHGADIAITIEGISLQELEEVIRDGGHDDRFITAYVLFLLACSLCPTCKDVAGPRFDKEDTKPPCNCGGCLHILMVVYFDHVRMGMSVGLPKQSLISAWTTNLGSKRICLEVDSTPLEDGPPRCDLCHLRCLPPSLQAHLADDFDEQGALVGSSSHSSHLCTCRPIRQGHPCVRRVDHGDENQSSPTVYPYQLFKNAHILTLFCSLVTEILAEIPVACSEAFRECDQSRIGYDIFKCDMVEPIICPGRGGGSTLALDELMSILTVTGELSGDDLARFHGLVLPWSRGFGDGVWRSTCEDGTSALDDGSKGKQVAQSPEPKKARIDTGASRAPAKPPVASGAGSSAHRTLGEALGPQASVMASAATAEKNSGWGDTPGRQGDGSSLAVRSRDFAESALNQKAVAESAEMEMVRAQNRAIEMEGALAEEQAKGKKLAEDADARNKVIAKLEARISELEKSQSLTQGRIIAAQLAHQYPDLGVDLEDVEMDHEFLAKEEAEAEQRAAEEGAAGAEGVGEAI
ncbi:hypothetical protein Acr_01g0008080 [Actinidia rufa]|uniref:Uncharacterized protein n=1 Tax=Actinidia rufa TaxID=165716 RepID=A0A7J0E4W9_9ERIC|nr:hypothetical protein Acr_01g0008080 [Actinidia rufa]